LGQKRVPIVNPAVLQGGYVDPAKERAGDGSSKFVAAVNGPTLSRASQPVPGGLGGLVPPDGSPPLVKAVTALFFESTLSGVDVSLELAGPASDIRVNEGNLAEAQGVALELPVKVRLENPLLGGSCYIGSGTSPLIWKLRMDRTDPPKPNQPIKGRPGTVDFLEGGQSLRINGAELVDNAWSAPGATGCGGPLAFLVDPIVNSAIGIPAAAGHNTARLRSTIYETTTLAVKKNDEKSS
jgi:hypothetical protein